MGIAFSLRQPIAGFAASSCKPGDPAAIVVKEMLSTFDGSVFASRLEALHRAVFSNIPGVLPWKFDHLLVVIKPNAEAIAYFDELKQVGTIKVGRAVQAGEAVYNNDIVEMVSLDIGVEIPSDCGFVFVRSLGWQRSLFYDFGPLADKSRTRDYDLKTEFARQAFGLIKATGGTLPLAKADEMRGALNALELLLKNRVEDEARYQELLETNPWILGGQHGQIERHTHFDDKNIPDFTGVRHHDGFRDIVELKQPFLSLFKKDGDFSSAFNEAWGQAERYLVFARRNRDYLASEKSLRFENPRCFLLAGFKLTPDQLRLIRDKESLNPAITVLTYESILTIGRALVDLTLAVGI
jgi:hypothetical protein